MLGKSVEIGDYDRPIKVSSDVTWVGIHDTCSGWLSSPYLVIDGEEAVLIDAGGRADFAAIMMKIMQAGIVPASIVALIYQNHNPRLWSSLQHLEMMISKPDLKIVSDETNILFLQPYSELATVVSLDQLNYQLTLSSGRTLKFIKTPFAPGAGSFMTFDIKSGVVFTGDLFSTYSCQWNLFLEFKESCRTCGSRMWNECHNFSCPLTDILRFHREIMSSERALKLALDRLAELPFTTIAPQHGSVISKPEDIVLVCDLLSELKGVGVDGIIGGRSYGELGNVEPIRKRLLCGRKGLDGRGYSNGRQSRRDALSS